MVPVVKGVAVDVRMTSSPRSPPYYILISFAFCLFAYSQISHINTPSVVAGYSKDDEGLSKALKGADLVVIPAGVPRKPGMTRDDLFNVGDIKNL